MADIVVYNLQDDGTPATAQGDQASVYTDATSSSPAAASSGSPSKAAPSGSAASPITEGDVRNIVKSEMEKFRGDIRVGSLLSNQAFVLDTRGMSMGGTEFSSAPFSVTYDGYLTATSGTFSGAISASTIDIGGSDSTSFHVDADGNMWLGAATFATSTFSVSNAGSVSATDAVILGDIIARTPADSNMLRGSFLYTIDVDSNNQVFGCSSNIVNYRDYYVSHDDTLDRMKIYSMFGLNLVSQTNITAIWASATDLAGRSVIMDYGSTCHVFMILSDGSNKRVYFTLDPTATSPTWTQATISGISAATTWVDLRSDGTNIYVWDSSSTSQLVKLTWNGTTTLTYDSTITYGTGGDVAVFTAANLFMTDDSVYCVSATINKKYSLAGTYQKEVPAFQESASSSIKKTVINADFSFYLPIFRGGSSSSTDYGLLHNLDGLY